MRFGKPRCRRMAKVMLMARSKLLGKKGINKGKFWIVLNRSFNNIPDALEVCGSLDEIVGQGGYKYPKKGHTDFVVARRVGKTRKIEEPIINYKEL